jgi:hypothetical protein
MSNNLTHALSLKVIKMDAKKIKSGKGQTLLEVIIASGIIVASVLTVITLGIVTVRGGRTSEFRVVAANLAREGIEYFRNVRDSNWLKIDSTSTGNWDDGLDQGSYTIEFTGSIWNSPNKVLTNPAYTFVDCGATCLLKLNANGLFSHSDIGSPSQTDTQFYRLISITNKTIDSKPAKNITAQVLWKEKGVSHTLTIAEDLTGWR